MIVFDTETTGLLRNPAQKTELQPEIIEFAAITLDDDTLEETGRHQTFIRPRLVWPLPPDQTAITGITTDDLESAPTFAKALPGIRRIFLGQTQLVAHNAAYDVDVMTEELRRINHVNKFPWPWTHTCTVELTFHFFTKRLKLADLHEHLVGTQPQVRHRAMSDVETLVACVRALRARGDL